MRAAAALTSDALAGPKRAAVALAVFFAASMLTVHLAYLDGGVAGRLAPSDSAAGPDATSPSAPVVPAPAPAPSVAGAAEPSRADAPASPPSLGVAPVPAPPASAARARAVAACVERAIQASGAGTPRTTAPGRWPALKRAREDLRLKRLAARTACEQDATL